MTPTEQLLELGKQLDDLVYEIYRDKENAYRAEKKVSKVLVQICDLVRSNLDRPDFKDLLSTADGLLGEGVQIIHESSQERPYLSSFAHSNASPEVLIAGKYNLESILGQGILIIVLQILNQFILPTIIVNRDNNGPSWSQRTYNAGMQMIMRFIMGIIGPSPPWPESPRAHTLSTRLSRFKPGVAISPHPSNTRATSIYQARCEISSEEICAPIRAKISSGGSCLAVITAGGYMERSEALNYRILDDNSTGTDVGKLHWIYPGFSPYELYIQDSHKLIFAADDKRINAFSWGIPSGENYEKASHVHTIITKNFRGPISTIATDRLIRAGKGTVAVWDFASLPPASLSSRKKKKALKASTSAQEGPSASGTDSPTIIKLEDSTLSPTIWEPHPSSPSSMICGFDQEADFRFSCIAVDLEHGGTLTTRYLGHGDEIAAFSTSSGDPNVFVTGCWDGYARLFDVRVPLPTMTFNVGRNGGECSGVALAYPDGIPTLFTGATRQQEVRLWDIRARSTVYDLSTGNTGVTSLAWDGAHDTLYAATECNYLDRSGNFHDYRHAKVPAFMLREERRANRDVDPNAMNDDAELAQDEQDSSDDQVDFERCWPKQAFHVENYYGSLYDAGDHVLLEYKFKEDPDLKVLPTYGRARVFSYCNYY